MEIIPDKIRNLWSAEEIRLLVLLSLFLQILLISFSLLRQQRRNKLLSLLLWSAYLGADYVATLALGNLLNKQNEAIESSSTGDIIALWAPFLLLHLGGPDTITSYSLEDNELWLRHLLGLILQVLTAIFIFLESLPSPHLWAVAIFVFASGILKYGERTWSLRSASMDQLRESMISEPDAGPNYVKFMQEFQSRQSANVSVEIRIEKEPPHPLAGIELKEIGAKEIILKAYHFFETFKRLTVDLMLSFQDRTESQEFFLRRYSGDAFRVVEVELSFLYDILHTKAYYVHSFTGRIMRTFSLAMTVLSLFLFHRSQHPFKKVDIIITYVLLVAAIALETAAILVLIFSDWTIVALNKSYLPFRQKILSQIQSYILKCLRGGAVLLLKIRKFFLGSQKWWSNSMRQYNLIQISLKEHNMTGNKKNWKRFLGKLQLTEWWDNWRYASDVDFSDDAKKLIFQELKDKATSAEGNATNYKRLKACRGEWVLREKGYSTNLDQYVKKEFDESILLWHIAAHLCYQEEEEVKKQENKKGKDALRKLVRKIMEKINNIFAEITEKITKMFSESMMFLKRIKKILERSKSVGTGEQTMVDRQADYKEKGNKEVNIEDHKKISKEISDYMMYLVMFQPAMLPAGIGKIRFQDTCAEAKKFFSDKNTEIMEELTRSSDHTAVDMPKQKSTTNWMIRKIYDCIKSKCFRKSQGSLSPTAEIEKRLNKEERLEKEKLACDFLLRVNANINPTDVKGDRSKSVLWEACNLAKRLREIKEKTNSSKKMWVIISAVWVEMLCYAAANCTAYAHAKQLSQGGELLTHVWLLMAHMGIGEQYRIESGHARAKLLVKI